MLKPEQFLWWASIVAESILLMRLLRFQLYRKYRWFTAYIVSDIVCSLAMMWLTPDPHSSVYAYAWLGTQPILLALQVALSVELYRLIAAHYRNFDQMRPRLFWTCLLSAVAVSGLSLFFDLRHIVWTNVLLNSMFLTKRSVTFALGGFVIATSSFVRIFHVPIRSNVTAHRRVASAYFLANAGYYCAMGVGLVKIHAAGIALMVITGGCFVAWAALLKPAGEDVDETAEPTGNEVEAHLRRGEELLGTVREVNPRG